ncbi:MAG: hypothetical protein K2P59_14020 [Acetatifactor sp.]|nr:hypothetical protein [Acetatifactor sp.]
MIDWDEVNRAGNIDELKNVKLWLFQENVRLENERKELALSREKFFDERVKLRQELDELNRKTRMEQKRLKEETLFFEKKMAILQDGFRHLDEDRQSLERQKKEFAAEKLSVAGQAGRGPASEEAVKLLFRGANNSLALRKRYRDLVKIFHPDNLFGDEELVQMINREYVRRREEQ